MEFKWSIIDRFIINCETILFQFRTYNNKFRLLWYRVSEEKFAYEVQLIYSPTKETRKFVTLKLIKNNMLNSRYIYMTCKTNCIVYS